MSDLQRRTVGAFIFLVPLAAAAVIFRIPIARAWSSRAFSEEVLHGYEQLYTGEKAGPGDSDNLPLRTGKVIILRPSTHFVAVTGGMTCVLFWTQITPEERGKITAKEDPPRIHDAWFEIDESLRPSTPDEVDTGDFLRDGSAERRDLRPRQVPGSRALLRCASRRLRAQMLRSPLRQIPRRFRHRGRAAAREDHRARLPHGAAGPRPRGGRADAARVPVIPSTGPTAGSSAVSPTGCSACRSVGSQASSLTALQSCARGAHLRLWSAVRRCGEPLSITLASSALGRGGSHRCCVRARAG
jgi:hypothetical protein